MVEIGLTKSIGVSNFNVQLMWDMLCYCKIKPVCNQIELNPINVQAQLVKFLKLKDILPIAYLPIARPGGHKKGDDMCDKDWPDLREEPCLKEIAQKHGKSVV